MISPSFLVGRCGHGVFGRRLVGAAGVLLRGGIFFNVLVGGGGGAAGPKELMGLVGAVTDGRVSPAPRSVEVEA